MPKIKFTALVADMKGKSNGSVFSTNKGGSYFRTNKGGTNKNNVLIGIQKSRLASLASAWRNLDSDTVDAWNQAVNLYPTKNAFGDVRIPSGYELFMRLNGSLIAQGFPRITVPAVPREQPPYGAVSIDYPDLYQFNPNTIFALNSNISATLDTAVRVDFSGSGFNVLANNAMSFRVKLNFDIQATALTFEEIVIFSGDFNSSETFSISFLQSTSTHVKAFIQYSFGGYVVNGGAPVAIANLINGFSFVIQTNQQSVPTFSVFIDGSEIPFISSTSGVFSPSSNTPIWFIGSLSNPSNNKFSISDFRYFAQSLSNDDMQDVKDGYILGTELWKMALNSKNPDGNFESFPLNANIIGRPLAPGSIDKNFIPFSFQLVPRFKLKIENLGVSGSFINIFATASISNGRNGVTPSFKVIQCGEWRFNNEFELQSAYKYAFGGVLQDSTVRFAIQYLDSNTGQLDANRMAVGKKRRPFKAGSELTEKVN